MGREGLGRDGQTVISVPLVQSSLEFSQIRRPYNYKAKMVLKAILNIS